ncbi:unnamed protein product [Polarella glacialis]|uniref:Uncharacterized protein n=1 Tax=Polarella glacialis TaxID=89957 RepID=A0A813H4E4_POLGL|nr:unnamed protein product [Polarella glacialis]CAE8632620.1 unnamed protein product [Polarella glacialis]
MPPGSTGSENGFAIALDLSLLLRTLGKGRRVCFSLRVPRLQRGIRCRQAAWSESRPGLALRLPCSVLVPPSLCSLPVISRDVPELRTSQEIRPQHPADQLRYHWFRQEKAPGSSTC